MPESAAAKKTPSATAVLKRKLRAACLRCFAEKIVVTFDGDRFYLHAYPYSWIAAEILNRRFPGKSWGLNERSEAMDIVIVAHANGDDLEEAVEKLHPTQEAIEAKASGERNREDRRSES